MADQYKKIYEKKQALVSAELIAKSDAEIDAAIPKTEPGMVIFTADLSAAKRKGLDGKWVTIESRGAGGETLYPDYEFMTEEDIDQLFEEE